jgi:hypothetical protein
MHSILADIAVAPVAHGAGIHALLEPLLFVVVAFGVWLFTRYQERGSRDVEQGTGPAEE